MRGIGCLLVGCGVVGDVHANALAELAQRGEARLAGVVDVDPARAEEYGRRWNVSATDRLDKALAWPGIEVVHVCVPSGLHAEVGIAAARSGKHVLVEKPIDVTLEAADHLIASAREAGVTLGVASQHRFDTGFRELRAALRDGELGRIVLGEARVKWYRSQGYYESAAWRGTYALDGGGALINQSIHYIDLLLSLCGPVERVSAYTATATHRIEVEDLAAAVLRFRNGATGTLLGSTAVYPGLTERLEIAGSDGSAILEDGELILLASRKGLGEAGSHGASWRDALRTPTVDAAPHAPPYGGRHTDQIADFVTAVREGREPEVTGADGRRALATVLAVYRSAAERREVVLDLDEE